MGMKRIMSFLSFQAPTLTTFQLGGGTGDANDAPYSEPPTVSLPFEAPPHLCVAAIEEVMADNKAHVESDWQFHSSLQPNFDFLQPVQDMVMKRSQSREIESNMTTSAGVPTSTATPLENSAGTSDKEFHVQLEV